MNGYLHMLYLAGDTIFAARAALYGLAHLEVLNLKDPLELALSRKAIGGFRALAPDAQRDPCPWEAALLVMSSLVDASPDCAFALDHSLIVFLGHLF